MESSRSVLITYGRLYNSSPTLVQSEHFCLGIDTFIHTSLSYIVLDVVMKATVDDFQMYDTPFQTKGKRLSFYKERRKKERRRGREGKQMKRESHQPIPKPRVTVVVIYQLMGYINVTSLHGLIVSGPCQGKCIN